MGDKPVRSKGKKGYDRMQDFLEFCFPEFPSSADRDSEEHEVLEFEVFFEAFFEAFLGAFLELGVPAVWGEGPLGPYLYDVCKNF